MTTIEKKIILSRKIISLFLLLTAFPSFAQIEVTREEKTTLENAVDSLMGILLDSAAAPGMQVYVSLDNEVLLHKAYGYQTYKAEKKVSLSNVYDLASVTKIAASTVALMKLHEKGKEGIYVEI